MSSSGDCFKTELIPVEHVLSLSPILDAYLKGSPKVKSFVSAYQNVDELADLIMKKESNYKMRSITFSVLKHQNEHLTLFEKQIENTELFSKETTFCITTAHQTSLFGGPLYFIQKAVSVIKACQIAKQAYPKYDFVPMFWLGSEDHDFEELNHILTKGKTIEWSDMQGGAFGRYKTDSLSKELEQLLNILDDSKDGQQLKNLFTEAYQEHATIAEATRYLLHQLLGAHGLLIIDGDDKVLKKEMIPIFKRELVNHFSSKACQQTIEEIESQYGSTQAHVRPINLFYLTDNGRHRIVAQPYGFSIHGTKLQFSESALLQELEQHPEKFSPNVMLRPLMQEMCLPNLMYVGGGGESTYWFQLKQIFEEASVSFPMIALRDTAVYLSQKTQKRMLKSSIELQQLFQPRQTLIKQLIERDTKHSLNLTEAKESLQEVLAKMGESAEKIDFTLRASAKAEEQRILNAVTNLEKKMMRAEKKNHKQLLTWVNEVFDTVFPKNSLQERKENFSQYYLEYGDDWIDWMIENFNLFDQKVKVLIENSN